jgi:Methyltransferase domain
VRFTNDSDGGSATRRGRCVIERLVRDGSVVARSDGTLHDLFPVAADAAEGEALRDWVLREGATRTVEIGLGILALHICEGLIGNAGQASRHVVIDPYQATRFSDLGLQFLDESGISLPRFLDEARIFDLAFVDGNHRFDSIFVDLFYLERLVRPEGIVILDDYQLPGVARAALFFTSNLGWTVEENSPADDLHQWATLRTSAVPGMRPFDYLVGF